MSVKRIVLSILAIILFVIGFIGLFPFTALLVLTGPWHMYTVGLSADSVGWHVLGAIGGAATIGGIWALSAAIWSER